MIITGITVEQFIRAVALAGVRYGDNLLPEIGTKYSETRFNARVIPAQTGYRLYGRGTELAPGQRRSWQGRRVNAVCWHAYRDVLLHVFNINPNARVRTMYAKYLGIEGFLFEYPGTAHLNVGSLAAPARPIELCDCGATTPALMPVYAVPSGYVTALAAPVHTKWAPKPLQHKPTQDEQEMIDWWAQQSQRTLARS